MDSEVVAFHVLSEDWKKIVLLQVSIELTITNICLRRINPSTGYK